MAFVTRGWYKLQQTYFNINIVENVFWNAEFIVISEWSVCTLVERYRRELEAEFKIVFFLSISGSEQFAIRFPFCESF